jgi:hypothetical protein
VPGAAPAGTYTYAVNVGDFPGVVLASSSFTLSKQGDRGTEGPAVSAAERWAVDGWNGPVAARAVAPEAFALAPPVPNPFSSRTAVRFTLGAAAEVRVAVYDGLGREVAVLADGPMEAGAHEAVLDASSLGAGVYLVSLTAGDGLTQTQRVVLLR